MKPTYPLLAVLCASVALTTSSCGDRAVTGPTPGAIQASVTNGSYEGSHHHRKHHRPPNLARCKPQHPDIVLERIGTEGGRIEIGPYALTVPPGALTRRVTIGARIRAGESVNVVEFKPDGLVFQTPASLSMSYAKCDVDDAESALRIAVVDDQYQILYYLPSTNDASNRSVVGAVAHFTNYAVAW